MSNRGRLEVSDHALVRWMQRTGLIDLDPVRNALRQSLERVAGAAIELGSTEFLILADGMVFVVRDGVVTTAMPEDGRHQHARLLARREATGDA